MKHCLMFSREIFYVTIVLCLNILWLKAVNEITARQTRASFAKFIKVCSIEYLTTQIELVLPTFKSWTFHKIIAYLALGLLSSLWNIYHSTTAYFFDPLFMSVCWSRDHEPCKNGRTDQHEVRGHACIRSDAHWPRWKYDWTIRARRVCGLVPNYCVW